MRTDFDIQQNIVEELGFESFLNSNEIDVSVNDGNVILTGTVDLYNKKLVAAKTAKKVIGVKAVTEEIEVNLPDCCKKTDSDIALAVINELKSNSFIPDDKIKVKVEKGWVTLEGELEWNFQRRASIRAVGNLNCVKGIINNIVIVPKIKSKDLKAKISEAFQSSTLIDADDILIEVDGSKVKLKGSVSSFSKKKEAEKTAWLAPGVSLVENDIEINSEVLSIKTDINNSK
jgi:osmotically-inducible protein OsmY